MEVLDSGVVGAAGHIRDVVFDVGQDFLGLVICSNCVVVKFLLDFFGCFLDAVNGAVAVAGACGELQERNSSNCGSGTSEACGHGRSLSLARMCRCN